MKARLALSVTVIYIYPPTPALAKAGAAPGTTEGVEPELSKSLLFWARKQKRQKFALARLWALGSVPDCGPYWPLEQPASGFWTLQTLQNLALARLWALGSARLWAELRRLWARGSGAPNRSFFSSGPKLPFKRLKPLKPLKRFDTCQWLCHTSGFWTLQTLHGCFRRSKTSHLLDCGQTVGHTGRWSSQLLDSGRFRRSKTSHLPDCGLWALRDCGGSCAGCGLGALARQILFF